MKKGIISDLQRVTSIFEKNEKEYLNGVIASKLNRESQENLFKVIQVVLKDEIAFLIEIEMRRQQIRESGDEFPRSSITIH